MKGAIHALFAPALTIILGLGASSAQAQTCGMQSWDLTAGQTMDVGTVTVNNDLNNLYITYNLDDPDYPGATFGTLHLWVGSDPANLPTAKGAPIPGRFSQSLGGSAYEAFGLKSYTFTIPFAALNLPEASSLCGTSLFVVTHAEVDLDGNPETLEMETAFGGGLAGTGKRWWFYDQYPVCCEFGDPEPPSMETAFAKGTHIWTTDPQSNPENLPSLNLSENRWGWAIHLNESGENYYEIWMGAGLNTTADLGNEEATWVGMLHTYWSDGVFYASYEMFQGYTLKEVHLYAQDAMPTQIAPGQYGYLDTFEGNQSFYTFQVPLSDLDGDPGVWVIAHAVVGESPIYW